MNAGILVIATASDLNAEELAQIETLIGKESFIPIMLGENYINDFSIELNIEEDEIEKIINLLRFKKVIYEEQ